MFMCYRTKKMVDGTSEVQKTYGSALKNISMKPEERAWTKRRGPFERIYYEACKNEHDARSREKHLKSGKGKLYLKKRLK